MTLKDDMGVITFEQLSSNWPEGKLMNDGRLSIDMVIVAEMALTYGVIETKFPTQNLSQLSIYSAA
jgi:hypothetical protein